MKQKKQKIISGLLTLALILGLMLAAGTLNRAEASGSAWTVESDQYRLSTEAVEETAGNIENITMVLIGVIGGTIDETTLPASGSGITMSISADKKAAVVLYTTAQTNAAIQSVLGDLRFSGTTTQVHIDITNGETSTSIANDLASDSNVTFGILNSNGEAHAYKYMAGEIDWFTAYHHAVSGADTLGGLKGYLATVTTADEASILHTFYKNVTTNSTQGAWSAGTSLRYSKDNNSSCAGAGLVTPTNYEEITVPASASADRTIRGTNQGAVGTYYCPKTSDYTSGRYYELYYWACGPEQGKQVEYSLWKENEPNDSDSGRNGEYAAVSSWAGDAVFNDFSPCRADVGGYFLEFSVYLGGADSSVSQKSTTVYKVSYNANGATGTVPAAQEKIGGQALTLAPLGDLEKYGYLFTGWNTREDGAGTNYAAGAAYTAEAGQTLYAQWKLDPDGPINGLTDVTDTVDLVSGGIYKIALSDGSVMACAGTADSKATVAADTHAGTQRWVMTKTGSLYWLKPAGAAVSGVLDMPFYDDDGNGTGGGVGQQLNYWQGTNHTLDERNTTAFRIGTSAGYGSYAIYYKERHTVDYSVKQNVAFTNVNGAVRGEVFGTFANPAQNQLWTFTRSVAGVTTDGGTTTYYEDIASAAAAWNSAGDGATLRLLTDVTSDAPVTAAHGTGASPMVLDLAGHGLRAGAAGYSAVAVSSGAVLTLTDSGAATAHKYTVGANGLAEVNDAAAGEGVKAFTGGYITGGSSVANGGVCVYGTLRMPGGAVVGNCGGGVRVKGSFDWSAGSIADNTGFGVYVDGDEGAFLLSGAPVISGNSGGRVYLDNGNYITVTGALTYAVPIGVKMASPGRFTDTAAAKVQFNDATKFACENSGVYLCKDGDGQLVMGTPLVKMTAGSEVRYFTDLRVAVAEANKAGGSVTLTLLGDLTLSGTAVIGN